MRPMIATHGVDGDSNVHEKWKTETKRQENVSIKKACLLALGRLHLAAAIVAAWAYVMAQVNFTRGWLNSQRWVGQMIVRTVHAALGWGFLVLLNSHDSS